MNTYAPGSGPSKPIVVGDVLCIVVSQGGQPQYARVVDLKSDGRPVLQWVAQTKARIWLTRPRVLGRTERVVRKAAPFEAAAFCKQVKEVEAA